MAAPFSSGRYSTVPIGASSSWASSSQTARGRVVPASSWAKDDGGAVVTNAAVTDRRRLSLVTSAPCTARMRPITPRPPSMTGQKAGGTRSVDTGLASGLTPRGGASPGTAIATPGVGPPAAPEPDAVAVWTTPPVPACATFEDAGVPAAGCAGAGCAGRVGAVDRAGSGAADNVGSGVGVALFVTVSEAPWVDGEFALVAAAVKSVVHVPGGSLERPTYVPSVAVPDASPSSIVREPTSTVTLVGGNLPT